MCAIGTRQEVLKSEISTTTTELKSESTTATELKSEISATTAELKTDLCTLGTGQEALKSDVVSIVEDKVDNCMSTITEGLKTDMNDLRSEVSALESRINEAQEEMKEKFERQQKEATSYGGTTDPAPPGRLRGHTERTQGPISSDGRSIQASGWRQSSGQLHYNKTTEI